MRLVHAWNDSIGEGVARPQPESEEAEVRVALSGVLCRCTGYTSIVQAVLDAAGLMRGNDERRIINRRAIGTNGIEKATGALRFPADINLPNMLWMKILRSPHAHARIVAVDATAAEKISGVAAVITHKDVPHVLFGPYQNEIYPLDEEIRFVGDTVAAVAARDWNVAEEAIRALRVTYEVLPAVHDPESGVQPGAPGAVLHYPESHELKPGDIRPDQLGTLGNVIGLKEGGPTVVNERGDVERDLRKATLWSKGSFASRRSTRCLMSRAPASLSMKTTPARSGVRCKIPIASKTVRLGF